MTELIGVVHFLSLPAAAALYCILVFHLSERRRGLLLMLSLSAAVSLNILLKAAYHIDRPWLLHAESAPAFAEGGYAFPCLHTMVMAAVLTALGLTASGWRKKLICTAGFVFVGVFRYLTGSQSLWDVIAGAALGMLAAALLFCYWYNGDGRTPFIWWGVIFLLGLISALFFDDGWGLGLSLTVTLLGLADRLFVKADRHRTRFSRIYWAVGAAGLYIALYIGIPFLVEWKLTTLWPGQALIVFLLTFLPSGIRFP